MAKKKKKAAKKKRVKKRPANEAKATRANKKPGAEPLENWLWNVDKPQTQKWERRKESGAKGKNKK